MPHVRVIVNRWVMLQHTISSYHKKDIITYIRLLMYALVCHNLHINKPQVMLKYRTWFKEQQLWLRIHRTYTDMSISHDNVQLDWIRFLIHKMNYRYDSTDQKSIYTVLKRAPSVHKDLHGQIYQVNILGEASLGISTEVYRHLK